MLPRYSRLTLPSAGCIFFSAEEIRRLGQMAKRTRGETALIHTSASEIGRSFSVAPRVVYAVHDPERFGYVVAYYTYVSPEASEKAAMAHAAGINAVREAHNAYEGNPRKMDLLSVVEYLGYWNGRPA